MRVLTVAQMKSAENNAVKQGVSFQQLMENAGTATAQYIAEKYYVINKRCLVLCGNGNNGGDGFVIARKLLEKGANVTVILCKSLPATKESGSMFEQLKQMDVSILDTDVDLAQVLFQMKQADYIIDCIFGTGFQGELFGVLKQLIDRVNSMECPKIAVDIPSGMNGDTGECGESYFHTDCTVALGAYKKAHVLDISREKCGEIILAQIGIPSDAFYSLDSEVINITYDMIKNIIPSRHLHANKGDFGKLLNISGSVGMGGAAIMSTQAALRCGAGLVTLAAPKEVADCCFPHIMEATTIGLPQAEDGTFLEESIDVLRERMNASTACLIGCGMGKSDALCNVVRTLIQDSKVPLILDADGINALCYDINILQAASCNIIMTPHPGEMSQLTGLSVQQIQENRIKVAFNFAKKFHVILILKGFETIIAMPDGKIFMNTTGNPGMAKGGSGDVLAGMLASFVAQGISLGEAAVLAVCLHGLCGDNCAQKYSQSAMLARDLIDELPVIFKTLGK